MSARRNVNVRSIIDVTTAMFGLLFLYSISNNLLCHLKDVSSSPGGIAGGFMTESNPGAFRF